VSQAVTNPTNPPVDIEALRKVAEATEKRTRSYAGDFPIYGRLFGETFTPTVILQLLDELTELRAARQWKPFWFDDSTPIREGETYLFGVVLIGCELSVFQDAIVWDEETVAEWREGGHGWRIEDVTHYAPAVPEPPEVPK